MHSFASEGLGGDEGAGLCGCIDFEGFVTMWRRERPWNEFVVL